MTFNWSRTRKEPQATRIQPLRIRLLQQARRWHRWLGLGFLLPTLLLGLTGILLNHKELFFGGSPAQPLQGLLTTASGADGLPLSFADALERGREVWGEIAIEKIELKEDKGRLIYKLAPGPGRELLLDAHSGETRLIDGLRVKQVNTDLTRLDWKKLTGELHSGKIVGLAGRLLMDAAALALGVLALSGLYLWALPRWQRRKPGL